MELTSHAVWPYFRFCLSFRDGDELLYLDNVIGQDHRRVKRRIRPTLGFKCFDHAAGTISGDDRFRGWRTELSKESASARVDLTNPGRIQAPTQGDEGHDISIEGLLQRTVGAEKALEN
jgi:transposase-like protein